MKDGDIFQEKLEILKLELEALNSRMNHISENVWRIRQIALTLWVASLSVGLGAISLGNQPNTSILILSAIAPVLFWFIDAGQIRWYHRYESRESEIRKFLNQKDYILPSTRERVSFEQCMKDQVLGFPVYDLTGLVTFGKEELYLWRTSRVRSFATSTPLIYYGLQILASVLYASLELNKGGGISSWWVPPLIVLLLVGSLHVGAKLKLKKLIRKMHSAQAQASTNGEHS